jgi:hypothetical protein
MKLRSRTILFGGTTVGVLTLAGSCFQVYIAALRSTRSTIDLLAAASQRGENPIEGTWRVTVTQKVCDGVQLAALSLPADLARGGR